MTITLIDTATPTVGLKAGADIINTNMTDTANAASQLMQTSPTDATPGRVLNNETTSIGGNVNYTEANLNPNLFKGASVNDYICTGEATGATTASFFLPLQSTLPPNNIILTGTFEALDAGVTIAYGSPTLNLAGNSSNKLAVITATGLAGMTTGANVYLRVTASNSSIEITY